MQLSKQIVETFLQCTVFSQPGLFSLQNWLDFSESAQGLVSLFSVPYCVAVISLAISVVNRVNLFLFFQFIKMTKYGGEQRLQLRTSQPLRVKIRENIGGINERLVFCLLLFCVFLAALFLQINECLI